MILSSAASSIALDMMIDSVRSPSNGSQILSPSAVLFGTMQMCRPLREQARRLREDPSAIAEIATRELGLIKPGERVFIVKDAKAPKAPQ